MTTFANCSADWPFVSIIVPVHNGGRSFSCCLRHLVATQYAAWELIVVDDGSSDGSGQVAQQQGGRLITTARRGPAAARNAGAAVANGSLLFFLDADVAVRPETVGQFVQVLQADPQLAACFGSYDVGNTAVFSPLSHYRNLLHHYTHQTASPNAATFWSGCGVIWRDPFWAVGGFDAARFPHPSIEDIELGYRLRTAGYSIRLEKTIQVTHLKRWTAVSMLHTDIYRRALPWSRLLVAQQQPIDHLNVNRSQQASALSAWLLLLTVPFAPLWPLTMGATAVLLALNLPFYQLLWRQGGWLLLLLGLLWHWLYFLYSSLTFLLVRLIANHAQR